MATLQIFGSIADGTWGEIQNASWTTARDTTSGTVNSSATTGEIAGWNNTFAYTVSRNVFVFDTSVLAGGTVTGVTLSLCAANSGGVGNGTNNYLVKFTGNNPLDNNGFNKTNFGSTFSANYGTLASTGLTPDAYSTLTGNAGMIADINTSGFTLIGCVTDNDYLNSSPSANASANGNTWYHADQSGTSKDPYLTVTYTPATSGGGFLANFI